MADLSPAAQAIKDAVLATYAETFPRYDNLWALECDIIVCDIIVAALRAAALYCTRERLILMAIADELEGQ
jgi:hypothetical protein